MIRDCFIPYYYGDNGTVLPMKHIDPLQHPRRSKDPAVSYDETGVTSWICQCRVMECQTPILPTGGRERATTWLSMQNRDSTKTCMLKVPNMQIQIIHVKLNNSTCKINEICFS